ncbi:MAG: biopolymer transporter ExbD [Pseudomonadota bacterium]|nr:biopolymer transporter ExbD [Pseudomonadota bacterium]
MRIVEKMKKINRKATFTVQITSMVDMMTILLVFLLNQQSASSVQVSVTDGLVLPISSTANNPIEALKVVVTAAGIFVNDKRVSEIIDGKIVDSSFDAKDKMFIPALYEELDKEAENSRRIASINETLDFDGTLVLQADSRLKYEVLKKVMYTATSAGYANIKMAAVAVGD